MGEDSAGLNAEALQAIAADLSALAHAGVELALITGGGNFFRGIQGSQRGMERARADSIGMLATVMNALALEGALETLGCTARTLSAVPMPALCESYSRQVAQMHLAKQRIIILAGGIGSPFFTTDTAAALRAVELHAHLLMKGTQVDGIYASDPKKVPNAQRYRSLTHDEAIVQRLKIMDTSAFALAQEHALPILVFSLKGTGSIQRALREEGDFTLVTP